MCAAYSLSLSLAEIQSAVNSISDRMGVLTLSDMAVLLLILPLSLSRVEIDAAVTIVYLTGWAC